MSNSANPLNVDFKGWHIWQRKSDGRIIANGPDVHNREQRFRNVEECCDWFRTVGTSCGKPKLVELAREIHGIANGWDVYEVRGVDNAIGDHTGPAEPFVMRIRAPDIDNAGTMAMILRNKMGRMYVTVKCRTNITQGTEG